MQTLVHLLLLCIAVTFALSESEYSQEKRAPRLRFQKKDFSEEYEREARAPRLRFQKKDDVEEFSREVRAPRLRFQKKDDGESYSRESRAPRLRFQKKDDVEEYSREARAPRLRFQKKDYESEYEREARAPRLRFVRRGARLRFSKRQPSEIAEAEIMESGPPYSRKRRSADSTPSADKRVDLSINNALRLLTDMVLAQKKREREQYLADLRQRMYEVGKRSASNDNPLDSLLKKMVKESEMSDLSSLV